MESAHVRTLYQRILGERFADLHPVLRRFHSFLEGGSGVGRLQVIRYPGRLRKLLAAALRLPPARDATEVRLEVSPTGTGERWERSFSGWSLVTRQTARGALLVEHAGPICFGLAVDVVDRGMVFQTRRVWLLGLPLPRWIAPAVEAKVVPNGEGWTVQVRLTFPGVGPLLQYRGEVFPQWT
jgi:hypothetical protein